MKVTISRQPEHGVTVLTLSGEFDGFVASPFDEQIKKVVDDGNTRIVFNMRLVRFINSTALGSMIKARKLCRKLDGDVVISQASETVRGTLEAAGIPGVFRNYSSDDEALVALTQGPASSSGQDD